MRGAGTLLRKLAPACDVAGAQLCPAAAVAAPPWQLGQARHKMTSKTTTKSQRFTLEIKPKREAAIREYWEESRGVADLACQHRFANFARLYPRYRDLDYLRVFMPRWDSAIQRIIAHDRGMVPANELARKHPFILNCRLDPLRWAKLAVRGRLPVYTWNAVLADLKRSTGMEGACQTVERNKKIKFQGTNPEWRSPGWEGCSKKKGYAADDSWSGSEDDGDDDEDEAWLQLAAEAHEEHSRQPDKVATTEHASA